MKMVAPCSCSRAAGTRGSGYRNLTDFVEFSVVNARSQAPSFFATKKKLEAAGEVEETM